MQESPAPNTAHAAEAGQAVYSKRVLSMYDWLVLGFSNQFVWKCPSRRILDLYNTHVTGNHLDVGVGTGYFLDKCQFPEGQTRLMLFDMNPNCLQATSQRVARYSPKAMQTNILEPIEFDGPPFDSIGLNYVLHCLPGTMETKSVVFDHLKPLLKPNGILFGSTLLSNGIRRGMLARRLMAFYNGKGIFSNTQDSLDVLKQELSHRFRESSVEVAGCGAIFWGRV